jgi:hypothetical protein
MEKKLTQQVIIPALVTVIVVLLSLVLAAKQHYGPQVFRVSIETFLIFILPTLPIIYGYMTTDKVGSALMGAMPFSGFFIVTLLNASNSPIFVRWLTNAIPFWLILITSAGLEGYLASQRKIRSGLVAICLYILCISLFFFGIR